MTTAEQTGQPALDVDAVAADLAAYTGAPGVLCIWSTPSRLSYTFDTDPGSISRAVRTVVQLDGSGESSIYHQGTTLRGHVPSHERGKNTTAHMWLRAQFDIDYGKPGYAPDAMAAAAAVGSSVLPSPTTWVFSGHGLYPRWEFAPAVPTSPDVELLIEDMAAELRRAFKAQGFELDPGLGKDPARIWRIPGTINRKYPDAPVPAGNVPGSGQAFTFGELRAVTPRVTAEKLATVRTLPGQARAEKTFTRAQADAHMERFGWAPLRAVGSGGRNIQLNTSAMMIGHFVPAFLSEHTAREMLRSVARRIGLEPGEIERTITSGLGDGMRDWQAVEGQGGFQAAMELVNTMLAPPTGLTAPSEPTPTTADTSAGDEQQATRGALNLPAQFWDARPSLKHIRDAALSQWACPDAVLGCVLARQSAYAAPGDRVDIGLGLSPLTLFAIPYGSPSAGKGKAVSVARDLLPVPAWLDNGDTNDGAAHYRERPLGSGEGLTESYFGVRTQEDPANPNQTQKVRVQVRRNILFVMDEGESLAKLAGRQGSTIATTLRRAWSGELLGEANASVERDRQLDPGSYSIGLIVSFQPATIAPLFDSNEVGGGTPHRFLFLAADDDTLPEEPPEDLPGWPGALELQLGPDTDGMIRPFQTPTTRVFQLTDPDALAEVRRTRWDGLRRAATVGELDGHMNLMRGRVAAHLAWLDGRLEVNGEDWALAGQVVDTSNRVRDAAVAYGTRANAERAQAFDTRVIGRDAAAHAAKLHIEEQREQERIVRVAGLLARKVLKDYPVDGVAGRPLREAAGRYRSDMPAALEYAVDAGWLIAEPVKQGGTRYRVGPQIGDVPPA